MLFLTETYSLETFKQAYQFEHLSEEAKRRENTREKALGNPLSELEKPRYSLRLVSADHAIDDNACILM